LPPLESLGNFDLVARAVVEIPASRGNTPLSSTCPNCGAPRETDALFCARCGRNFSTEFKGTPLAEVKEVTDTFRRLRESVGDRYEIERELGRGGMATVFLARDIKHDRQVAIKVLHPELSASIGADRFEREIKLAAKLQHPHILGLYDSGNADGLLYYVMPFVKGESLRDRLDREKMLPVEDAIRLTLEICGALQHAHDAGIVHRDIKPENILLAHDHALVADFGIARAANEAGQQKLTQTGMAVGTPVYMAPEQSSGDIVGPTADIYSLGCMLYEMLAGEPPFTGQNAMAIMAKHLMEQVPSVRVVRNIVPEEVENAIFFALAKAPVDRPRTAQVFAEMLGTPLGTTATMRVMRGSAMMRGSMAMRRTPSGSVYDMQAMVEPTPVAVWKRPSTIVAGLAIVASASMGFWALNRDRSGAVAADPNARRIAVLYFDDLSADSSLGPVANGLTEGVIRSLSRVSQITTLSSGASQAVRGMRARDSIATRLKVGYLVAGDLELRGDRVAVNYTLHNSTGGRIGRPGRLEVARDSVALVQDSLATRVAELIRAEVFPEIQLQEQRADTRSNAAWLAVQDGAARQQLALARRAANDVPGSDRLFDEADSTFALAEGLDPKWVEPVVRRAALAYARSRLYGADAAQIRPWVQRGIGHADRALAINREDPDALEISGTLRFWAFLSRVVGGAEGEQWLARSIADLEASKKHNPNQAGAWNTLSAAYYQIPGQGVTQAYAAAQRAIEADEFLSSIMLTRTRLFNAAYDLGLTDQADQACRELEARYAGTERAVRCRLYLQAASGRARYDIDRVWRLTDSLVAAAPRDSARQRLVGGTFAAATIAQEARRLRASGDTADAAFAQVLADSARRVARRYFGDAIVDQARDVAMYSAFASGVIGDRDEVFRKLRIWLAVDPARAKGLAAEPGWFFREYASTPEWERTVGRP
jgi:serine/threonine protein kinase